MSRAWHTPRSDDSDDSDGSPRPRPRRRQRLKSSTISSRSNKNGAQRARSGRESSTLTTWPESYEDSDDSDEDSDEYDDSSPPEVWKRLEEGILHYMNNGDRSQRSKSRSESPGSTKSSLSDERIIHFRPPVLRRGRHRERQVYIKKRYISGVDLDILQAAESIVRPMNSRMPVLGKFARKAIQHGTHWAVEIGPWTIELGKDPETLEKPIVTMTHNDQLDPSWEKELGRIHIGSSTLSDSQLMNPERFIGGHPRKYRAFPVIKSPSDGISDNDYRPDDDDDDIVPVYANCQLIAAKIAVFIADNPWKAYDKLYTNRTWLSQFLDMVQVHKYLKSMHPNAKNSLRCLVRGVSLMLRPLVLHEDSDDENCEGKHLGKRLAERYERLESTVLSTLAYI